MIKNPPPWEPCLAFSGPSFIEWVDGLRWYGYAPDSFCDWLEREVAPVVETAPEGAAPR